MLSTLSRKISRPYQVGITGGIGSGKSLTCAIFKILGVPVFEADKAAGKLYNEDKKLKEKLISYFGTGLYDNSGKLIRPKLASIIFNDTEALRLVNELVHPLVREVYEKWNRNQNARYVLYEAAIMYESGYYRLMDANILVTAPVEVRIQRVIERDRVTREQVVARMRNQRVDQEDCSWADFIIRNDGSDFLITQVLDTDQKIREYGKFC